jgi:hypothetical protein
MDGPDAFDRMTTPARPPHISSGVSWWRESSTVFRLPAVERQLRSASCSPARWIIFVTCQFRVRGGMIRTCVRIEN